MDHFFYIGSDEVSQVVLVGGGSQLFTLVEDLRHRFGEEKILLSDNPDEIVVQGIGLEYGKSFQDYHPTIRLDISQEELLESLKIIETEKKSVLQLVAEEDQYQLTGSGKMRVGRDRENEIHINGDKISRFHAELNITEEAIELVDLNSTNGTFINDERMSPETPQELTPGDKIRFGDHELILKSS